MTARQASLILDRVEVGDECWEWRGKRDDEGYGKTWWGDTTTKKVVSSFAHRVVYRILVGPIAGGLELDHLCRNRGCVRPSHLDPVTHRENVLRGSEATKTHCVHGHEFTVENTYLHRGIHRYCRICKRARAASYEKTRAPRHRSAVSR